MKRGTFRKKSYDEAIAQLSKKKRTTWIIRGHRAIKKPRQKKIKVHWKPPAWFMVIPLGSHGNNPIQKRLWKLTSDFVRIFDWELYGVCASCGKKIQHWQDGDCGHYKAWSVCNNYFKFDKRNLALQCSNCNRLSDGSIGHNFGETLKKRRGDHILQSIENHKYNLHGGKLENIKLVQLAKEMVDTIHKEFTIKPDYYEKIIEKLE